MTPTAIAIVAALVGPLLAYVAAARRLSGRIGTSEAGDLWEESRSIRQDYQRRIEELNRVVGDCAKRIDSLEERNAALFRENENLKYAVATHERTIKKLTAENVALRKRVKELEA
jgi:cell division protein FtsB